MSTLRMSLPHVCRHVRVPALWNTPLVCWLRCRCVVSFETTPTWSKKSGPGKRASTIQRKQQRKRRAKVLTFDFDEDFADVKESGLPDLFMGAPEASNVAAEGDAAVAREQPKTTG